MERSQRPPEISNGEKTLGRMGKWFRIRERIVPRYRKSGREATFKQRMVKGEIKCVRGPNQGGTLYRGKASSPGDEDLTPMNPKTESA